MGGGKRTDGIENVLNSVPLQLLVGANWRDGHECETFAVANPATECNLTQIADACEQDAISALESAYEAQRDWASRAPRERGEILRAAYERLIADCENFSALMSAEMGKSVNEARGEVAYAAEFLRWFSEEAVRIHGRYQLSPNGTLRHLISKRPVGPCLLITPWNFPLAMITRKVGPAIAAGCTMILKPAQATPLTAARFVSLMQEVGLPAGVLNFLPTSRSSKVVDTLLADTRLKKVSFTGSTHVGRIVLKSAAQNITRASMELGGNAPFIVFDDANIEAAVEGAVQAKLRNIGQACTAANRFYVHETVKEKFTEGLRARFADFKIGHGDAGDESLGPLISESARAGVHSLVEDAIACGAKLVCGGEIPQRSGYYYPPTILHDVPERARVMREEIFGPVAPISGFSSEQEVIEVANKSDWGLASYVYTQNLTRALRVKEGIDAGMVGVNSGVVSDPAAPFGGVKQSGLGREGGQEGIEEYLCTKYAGIGMTE